MPCMVVMFQFACRCILLATLLPGIIATPAFAQFSGGDGSAESPWQIATAAEFDQLRNYLGASHADKHYVLIADIDLWAYRADPGWNPIGAVAAGQQFHGRLDGDGHAIRNLRINRPAVDYQGLFGYLNGARVENLNLEGFDLVGRSYLGALAGFITGGLIDGVFVDGRISGANYVGGLAGQVTNGAEVHRSGTNVDVLGQQFVGGLIGQMTASSDLVSQSHTRGSATATSIYLGGLIGYLGQGTVMESYSHATVDGVSDLGGLIGYTHGSSVVVQRSFSTGPVSGSGANIGGFLGRLNAAARLIDNYWDTESSGQASSAGGAGVMGRTTAQMQQRATFVGYNFNSLWQIEEGAAYPRHQDLFRYAGPAPVALADLEGEGTEDNPWIITNADELNAIRQDLSAHYRLGNDIDLSATVIWDRGRGWQPIGASGAGQWFTGSLDGNGHVLRHLHLSRVTGPYQGLFGYVQNATFRDLHLESMNLVGGSYTGGLAGFITGGLIDGVFVDGRISGANYVGGLAGQVTNGAEVHRSGANVDVLGQQFVGGLIGQMTASSDLVSQSHTRGSATATGAYLGGLIGYLGAGNVLDSYSHATVDGVSDVGGLIGLSWSSSGTVQRSYSVGPVSGSGANIGGFLGRLSAAASLTNNYWDTETSGQASSAGGAGVMGRTTAQMQQRATFVGYNFNSLWRIREGFAYPIHQDLFRYAGPVPVALADLEGEGTVDNPWIITNADELNAIRQDLSAHYRLGNDIDLSATVIWDRGRGWQPIGASGAGQWFTGSLDGNGHVLRHLHLSRVGSSYQGLFGYVQNATIRNLRLASFHVVGRDYTGALAGFVGGGLIDNVSATGRLSGANYVGGLAGQVTNGAEVHRSRTDVDVLGTQYVGGLVGQVTSSVDLVSQSYSRGSATATSAYLGGLIGYIGSGNVLDSYSHATVDGASDVGGLIGYTHSSAVTVERSYSAGPVSGSGSNVGGFLGRLNVAATLADNYWDIESSSQASSAGGAGVMGRTTAQMQQQANFTNWDFTEVWSITEASSYPRLQQAGPLLSIGLAVRWHRNGGSSGHTLDIRSNTSWTASTNDDWIQIIDPLNRSGNGSLSYALAPNPLPTRRIGSIVVTDGAELTEILTVVQGAELAITPRYRFHDAPASSGHELAVSSDIDWTAVSDSAWIVITSGASGSDEGLVRYEVAAHTGLSTRQGNITVTGGGLTEVMSIEQAAASTYLATSPSHREHAATASSGHVVNVSSNAAWTAMSDSGWLVIGSGGSGVGDGSVLYSVAANTGNRPRFGSLVVSDGTSMMETRINQAAGRSIHGVITGLIGPTTLQNNGGDDLILVADGGFGFAGLLADGDSYQVTVFDSPPGSFCQVFNGSGTVSGENVSSVLVTCFSDTVFRDRFEP